MGVIYAGRHTRSLSLRVLDPVLLADMPVTDAPEVDGPTRLTMVHRRSSVNLGESRMPVAATKGIVAAFETRRGHRRCLLRL